VIGALVISSCETGPATTAAATSRALPAYEAPLAKTDFQNVRTTAYTHTELDHTQYGARNALGGELHAAGPAIHRAENVSRARSISDSDEDDVQRVSTSGAELQPFSSEKRTTTRVTTTTTTRATKTKSTAKRASAAVKKSPRIGSAAADWGRWPAGTTFRLISTGQLYRVDDFGWALSGRNTIDLYMANSRDMNTWGTRQEPIQIMQWGDRQESLRLLAPHQQHPHVKRMMLEIEDREQEAAAMK
jgi:3D (Asp-Asp-Asp) domain-containing protein